jgi:hypothetical protein
MINKLILVLAVTLFLSGNAFSAVTYSSTSFKQVEFDINGIKIGDELTEKFFNKYCFSELKDSDSIECKQRIKFNDVTLSVLYFFYDAKLLAISITYPSSQYKTLVDSYKKKFTISPFKQSEPILVSTDEKYINEKSSWNTTSGEFVVERYGNSLKKGIAYLMSDEYEKYVIKKKEEINPGIFRKIFGNILDSFASLY